MDVAGVTGTQRISRLKLGLCGQGRVGKTSLSRALTGQAFRPDEASTDACETPLCTVSAQDIQGWSVKTETSKDSNFQKDLAAPIAQAIAARSKKEAATAEKGAARSKKEAGSYSEMYFTISDSLCEMFGAHQAWEQVHMWDEHGLCIFPVSNLRGPSDAGIMSLRASFDSVVRELDFLREECHLRWLKVPDTRVC